jgi:hypothetical protein
LREERYVPIYRAPNEPTASIVRNVLEDAGIPVIVNPQNASLAYDGVIALAEGFWGVLLVPESRAEEAARILDEYTRRESDDAQEE